MAIDSLQKRFIVNMQLKQCFARAKPFPTEKMTDKMWLFLFSKKAKWFEQSQNFHHKLVSISQTGDPVV